MTATVGVVIPAFRPDVDRLAEYVGALHDVIEPATVRVEVDDPDATTKRALDRLPATVHTVPYRRGKGAAITSGFESLETNVRVFADADGATPPASLARVIDPVVNEEADLAVGSRRHPDASVSTHQTLARRYMGDAFAWLARRLLSVPLYDYQCGAKAITADGWTAVREHLYEPGFAWDIELVAMAGALDLRVSEVPIEWHDQPGSTVSPVSTSLSLGWTLLTARHRAKRLRNDRLHTALDVGSENPTALVDRE